MFLSSVVALTVSVKCKGKGSFASCIDDTQKQ